VSTVVDDAILLAILTKRAAPHLLAAAGMGEILTTGSWYYRLHRAIHDEGSTGSLSRAAADLSSAAQAELHELLDDLPPDIVVPGPRLLVPVMGSLRLQRRVNYLTAEALATAIIAGANIRTSTEAPLLSAACAELGISLELRPPTG
jgi:hypothetical protein